MQDFEKLGAFYLGRSPGNPSAPPFLYDSKDLVTHAVCVGMTGSGKTGLCIDLLEEAAIDGVPALVIDPKGDIANLLLQFPQLRTEDFQPWVNEDDAKRQNLSIPEFAAQQAELWKQGLASWGQTPERIALLQRSAEFAIYTPGSDAGLPLSILKSFEAPPEALRDDREAYRDRISGTATAMLSLLGIDAEPMKSREHILLSNIFDAAWKNDQSLTLEDLVHQIQSPPITRVGVVDLEAFYPAKERFELAMSLNNLLASPGFDCWLQGEPLDISRLLYNPAGKPKVSILSIAHLSDTERMFVVTLVLNELLGWMRAQSGTTSLRAILYMDEIFGYFPPVANPPSKRPLLTLLKQARAFGLGIVLATQNPVDLDYKGLSNAGTWFIGRLQTERDKQRLLEGLEGASNEGGGQFDRAAMEQTLAGLGKRVFLMNNVHEDQPVLFESRWALSYLRGPMTRSQIRAMMQGSKATQPANTAPAKPNLATTVAARIALPPDIPQRFIPLRAAEATVEYHPMLLALAQIRYLDPKQKIDYMQDAVYLTPIKDDTIPVEWEESSKHDLDANELETEPVPGAQFAALPSIAAKAKSYPGWQKDLVTWIYGHQQLELFCDSATKQCSQPEETQAQFRARVQQSGRELRDAAVDKLRQKYQPKLTTLQDRALRAQQAVQREKEQSQGQILSTVVGVGVDVLGAFFGRKKITTAAASAIKSAGRIRKDTGDVGRAEETLSAIEAERKAVNDQLQAEIQTIQAQFPTPDTALETTVVKPKKANINIRLLTLAWAPYANGQAAWE